MRALLHERLDAPLHADATLRARIRRRQPYQWPMSAYGWGWVQACIQLSVFAISLWLLQGETRPLPVLLYAMTFGWAWFCLLMVGHDAMHQAFFPSRRLNQLVAFLTLDCLLFSRASWRYGHNLVHHGHPYCEEDKMYLRGESVAKDMWNLLCMVLDYIAWDLARLFVKPSWPEWLGMSIRAALIWSLLPVALLPAILFLLLFGNYLGLLSHAIPVARGTKDLVLRQLRTTWDLYPSSFTASLLTGGLNAHATHHVYPSLPRGAHRLGTQILREEAGMEYRCVDSLSGLWTLFRLRGHFTLEVAAIEAIAATRTTGIPGWSRLNADEVMAFAPVSAGYLAGMLALDLRKAERRVTQIPLSFPDRRKGDRRASPRAAG